MKGQLLDQDIQLNEAQQNFWVKKDAIAHAHQGFFSMIELLFDRRHRAHLHPQTGREIALFALYAHHSAFGDFYSCEHCKHAVREDKRGLIKEMMHDFHMLKQSKLIDELPIEYPSLPIIDEDTSAGMSWLNDDSTEGRAYREYAGGPIRINSARREAPLPPPAAHVRCVACQDEGCYRCQPRKYRKAKDSDFMLGAMAPNGADRDIMDELERYGVEITS